MMRCGIGIDTHAFGPTRDLILGGITVPHTMGLLGHSDADVLTHAVIDALLGACAQGNIGTHFPDTDPAYKNASSLGLLCQIMTQVIRKNGYEIGNIDATILCQAPRLNPHILAMRASLSEALGCTQAQVSIKATTGEYLGFVGRQEGITVHAIALLVHA